MSAISSSDLGPGTSPTGGQRIRAQQKQADRALPRVALRLPGVLPQPDSGAKPQSALAVTDLVAEVEPGPPALSETNLPPRPLPPPETAATPLSNAALDAESVARKRSVSLAMVKVLARSGPKSPWQKLRALGYLYLMFKQPQVLLAAVAAIFIQLAAALMFSQPADPNPISDVVVKGPVTTAPSNGSTAAVDSASESPAPNSKEMEEPLLPASEGQENLSGSPAASGQSSPVYEVAERPEIHPESPAPLAEPGVATLREPEAAETTSPEQDSTP